MRFALLLAVFFAFSAHAQEGLRAKIFVVESIEDFQLWMESRPAPDAIFASVKEVGVGRKVHFPIVATGLRPPQRGEMKVVADVVFIGPDGKALAQMKECCSFTLTNRPDIRTVMLGPTPSLVLEARDKKGIYTIRVAVSDGAQTVVASEDLRFGAGEAPAAAGGAAPRLNMGEPPAKNPGRDADKRDCLGLPTPAEVIKCTEQK